MTHKFSGMPSLGWLSSQLKHLLNQRVIFTLTDKSDYTKWLKSAGFDTSREIQVNGIYRNLFKKPLNRSLIGFVRPNDCVPAFEFRDCLFLQDDKQAMILSRTRRQNKKRNLQFWLHDIDVQKSQMLDFNSPRKAITEQ